MSRVFAVLAVLVSSALQGQTFRFDPPAPDSRTPVAITLSGIWGDGCPPLSATATVALATRTVNLRLEVSQFPCNLIPIRAVDYRVSAHVGVLAAGVYSIEARVRDTGPVVARGKLLVREATPALTVTPSVLFGTGTQKVRIRTSALGTCPALVDPCFLTTVSVSFNGVASPGVTIVDSDHIDAVVPRLDDTTDPIRVVVTTSDGRRAESATALFVTGATGFVNAQLFERILLPVVSEGPGAFGARWTTDAWSENAEDYDVPFFRAPFPTPPCAAPLDCNFPPVPAGQRRRVDPSYPTGIFLYPERGADIRLGVLVRDLSRQSEALGAEVPVVREDDWKTGAVTLLNVPSDPRFRVALRIYMEEEIESFPVAPIRITRMNGQEVIETVVAMDRSYNGQIPSTGFIADILTHYSVPPGEPLRVEVRAPQNSGRFWAFISVTNNVTQHVTIISPQ
jgi:hypothetical protein